MIKNRRKALFSVPESLLAAEAELDRIAITADKESIKSDIYKGKKRIDGKDVYEVRDILCEIYHNKCAYCETKEHKPEVEHYRPKKGITDNREHPGYYWLCYEWSNLIPVCRYCNTEGGKGNKFPVRRVHVSTPPLLNSSQLDRRKCQAAHSPLLEEEPYLLNPEVDDPELFFVFTNKGEIKGCDPTNRGHQTAKICNLNRDNLLYRRQQVVDGIKERIIDAFAVYFEVDESLSHLLSMLTRIFKSLDAKMSDDAELSLMVRYCYRHFDELIIPLIPTDVQRALLSQSFEDYISGRL